MSCEEFKPKDLCEKIAKAEKRSLHMSAQWILLIGSWAGFSTLRFSRCLKLACNVLSDKESSKAFQKMDDLQAMVPNCPQNVGDVWLLYFDGTQGGDSSSLHNWSCGRLSCRSWSALLGGRHWVSGRTCISGPSQLCLTALLAFKSEVMHSQRSWRSAKRCVEPRLTSVRWRSPCA